MGAGLLQDRVTLTAATGKVAPENTSVVAETTFSVGPRLKEVLLREVPVLCYPCTVLFTPLWLTFFL